MIDFSKYEKVYSWNDYQGKVFSCNIMVGPVCFIIKIGNSAYIGETTHLSILSNHHLMLLRKNKHPNFSMQKAFNNVGEFDLYILEQLPLHTCIPRKVKERYIDQLNPDLNEGDKELSIERVLCSNPKDGEMVSFYIEPKVKSSIDKICKKHGITFDEMVYSAVLSFLHSHRYIDDYSLDQEGVAHIAESLYTNVAYAVSELDAE